MIIYSDSIHPMSLGHQDWKPAVIHKKITKEDHIREGSYVTEARRTSGNKSGSAPSGKAVTDELPSVIHAGHAIGSLIMDGRRTKKWSQEELARACSMTSSIIKSYENGTAIYNSKELGKICRALGIATPAKPK